MIDKIIKDIENFNVNFTEIPDSLKARVVAKTTLVGLAVFATTGLLFGGLVGALAFVATAIYVSTSVAGRLNSVTALTKDLKKEVKGLGKQLGDEVEDMTTSFCRDIEDGFDFIFSSTSELKKKQQVKRVERQFEDAVKRADRELSFSWDEFIYTMSL